MKIALFGYGKMGKEVELAAEERGHEIVARIDVGDAFDAATLKGTGAAVAIDFSLGTAVLPHVEAAAKAKLPIVIGTTGWESDLDRVKKIASEAHVGCISASNFSIGVNLFFAIVQHASGLLGAAGYDAFVVESHHKMKKDYPSGTALRLGEAMLSAMPSKTKIISQLAQGEAIASSDLMISSVRAGTITGIHCVGFDSEEDSIELLHTAKSRKGFASGAVRAAEWIVHHEGFYRFEDSIREVLGISATL